jgi:hypothetical protein
MKFATRFEGLLLAAMMPLVGCAAGPTRAGATASTVSPATGRPIVASTRVDPPDTRRVRGVDWSAAVPADWTDGADENGVPMWSPPLPPTHPQRRAFSVQVVRGAETFDQLIESLPGIYRQRDGVATARRFTFGATEAAELDVRFPSRVQQLPTFLGVFIEGARGVIVTCGGERDETVERFCRTVIDSAWMGATARATPPGRAPSGTRWFGAQGRYVQIPEAWGPLANLAAPEGTAVGAADEGEHHAVVLHFINDLQIPPQQALEGAVRGIMGDGANTVVRQTPYQHGRRVGVLIDATRAAVQTTPTSLIQWVIPAGPGAFYTLNCAGPSDDFAARPRVCRDVFESFTPVAAQ